MRLFKRHRKDGRLLSYYVEFEGGKRISLKTKDKTEATKAYRKLQRTYLSRKISKFTGGGSCVTLRKYYDEFVKWAETIQKKSTFRANRLALDKLIHHAGEGIDLSNISAKHIDIMVAHEMRAGNKPGSINRSGLSVVETSGHDLA